MHDYVYEHIVIAEKAFGKSLPLSVQIHHVNEVCGENRNSNLVICQDAAYHQLLHHRARALKFGGSVRAMKCTICKQWDLPDQSDLTVRPLAHGSYHRSCAAKQQLAKYHAKKGEQ